MDCTDHTLLPLTLMNTEPDRGVLEDHFPLKTFHVNWWEGNETRSLNIFELKAEGRGMHVSSTLLNASPSTSCSICQ